MRTLLFGTLIAVDPNIESVKRMGAEFDVIVLTVVEKCIDDRFSAIRVEELAWEVRLYTRMNAGENYLRHLRVGWNFLFDGRTIKTRSNIALLVDARNSNGVTFFGKNRGEALWSVRTLDMLDRGARIIYSAHGAPSNEDVSYRDTQFFPWEEHE